jgi:DNA-binding LytR/AlgR family response regulator
MRLYELEEALEGYEFVRISRQEIVNFDHVRKVRPEANGRLVLELNGGTRVLVTRSFSASIKRILGIAR